MSDAKKRPQGKGFIQARSSNERLRKHAQDHRKHSRAAMTKRLRYGHDDHDDGSTQCTLTAEELVDLVEKVKAPSFEICLSAMKTLRGHLCSFDPPIQAVVDAGLIPIFARMLSADDQLAAESLWCLTNISAGDRAQTRPVIELVPLLLQIMAGEVKQWKAQICWIIGNLAGDTDEYREILLANGCLKLMMSYFLELFDASAPAATASDIESIDDGRQQTVAWALSNLARGTTPGSILVESGLVNLVARVIDTASEGLCTELCWILVFVTAKDIMTMSTLLTNGIVQKLINILCSRDNNSQCLVPTIRCLGNLTSASDECLAGILAMSEAMQLLSRVCALCLLANDPEILLNNRAAVKECFWLLTNLLSCHDTTLAQIISVYPSVIHAITHGVTSEQFDFQREALLGLQNAVRFASCRPAFKSREVFSSVIKLLSIRDCDLAVTCMRVLSALLANATVESTSVPINALQVDRSAVLILLELDLLEALEWYQYGPVDETLRAAALHLADIFEIEEEGKDDMAIGGTPSVFQFTDTTMSTSFEGAAGGVGFTTASTSGVGAASGGRGRHLATPAWMTSQTHK